MDDYTKITQDPKIATQIIDRVLGANGGTGVTILVVNSIHINVQNGKMDAKQQKLDNRIQIEDKSKHAVKYKHTTKDDIIKALAGSDWIMLRAAKLLEISYSSLQQRIAKFGGVKQLRLDNKNVE